MRQHFLMGMPMRFRKFLAGIGIVLFIYILSTLDFTIMKDIFTSIDLLYLIPCLFMVVPVALLSNYQWQVLLGHHKMKIGFFRSLKNIFIGYFYGFITPGGIGGYTRILYLHDQTKIPLKKCVSNIVLHNTVDYISLLLIGFIGGLLLTLRFPQLYTFEILILILICIVLLLLYVFILKKEKLKHVFNSLIRFSFFNPYRDRLGGTIEEFYEDLPLLYDLSFPFVLSVAGWVLRFFEFYLIAQLFSVYVPLVYFIAIFSVSDVVASIPITIYGLGTREIALISLFSLFHVPAENVIGLSLFLFVVSWILPSVFGAFVTVSGGKNTSC